MAKKLLAMFLIVSGPALCAWFVWAVVPHVQSIPANNALIISCICWSVFQAIAGMCLLGHWSKT